jgi:hypothetical protein
MTQKHRHRLWAFPYTCVKSSPDHQLCHIQILMKHLFFKSYHISTRCKDPLQLNLGLFVMKQISYEVTLKDNERKECKNSKNSKYLIVLLIKNVGPCPLYLVIFSHVTVTFNKVFK